MGIKRTDNIKLITRSNKNTDVFITADKKPIKPKKELHIDNILKNLRYVDLYKLGQDEASFQRKAGNIASYFESLDPKEIKEIYQNLKTLLEGEPFGINIRGRYYELGKIGKSSYKIFVKQWQNDDTRIEIEFLRTLEGRQTQTNGSIRIFKNGKSSPDIYPDQRTQNTMIGLIQSLIEYVL